MINMSVYVFKIDMRRGCLCNLKTLKVSKQIDKNSSTTKKTIIWMNESNFGIKDVSGTGGGNQ